MDDLYGDVDALCASLAKPAPRPVPTQKLLGLARGLAVGLSLSLGAAATNCQCVDPAPRDSGTDAAPDVTGDPLVPDSGLDADQVVDPLPADAGVDADEDDAQVADPLPEDAGVDADEDDAQVADPLPEDAGVDADVPSPGDPPPRDSPRASLEPRGQWRDTGARRAARSPDLPLAEPPDVQIRCDARDGVVHARLVGGPAALTVHWEAEGEVSGNGREVRWTPADDDDRLVVAVRGAGGVTIVSASKS